MACTDPNYALQLPSGIVRLVPRSIEELRRGELETGATALLLPCGSCLGCRKSRAREWAYRCSLELQQHREATFLTLTYDELHVPPTLSKRHLQLFWKRLRRDWPAKSIRYFSCGEYGTKTARPHYHAIVFGIDPDRVGFFIDAWRDGRDQPMGFVDARPVNPARIAYTAGYVSKKIGWRESRDLRVDPSTGEEYKYQPPFILMSRRPGLGKAAALQHPNSFRLQAIYDGSPIPVPRFLHSHWVSQASDAQKLKLKEDKLLLPTTDISSRALRASALIHASQQSLAAAKRTKL